LTDHGIVFDISRFSLNDGIGIRTTVFLKGCPLRCIWCHNPEAQRPEPQHRFYSSRCVGCQACQKVCAHDVHDFAGGQHRLHTGCCTACGKCVSECVPGALDMTGRQMTADEVMAVVLKDKAYYDTTGGGLTISGGEPFLQFSFISSLLKKAKEYNIHTVIETCGFADSITVKELFPYVDIFLFDYKLSSEEEHIRYTGVSNRIILQNLDQICNVHGNVILRCPVIPGINDTKAHFQAIHSLSSGYPGIKKVELMPYHDLGCSKAESLGAGDYFKGRIPAEHEKEGWIKLLNELGCKNVQIG